MNAIAPEIYRATAPPNFSPDGQKQYRRTTFDVRPASTGFSRREAITASLSLR